MPQISLQLLIIILNTMLDILEPILQGLNDFFGRIIYLFRKHLNYAEVVRSSTLINDSIALQLLNVIDHKSIPQNAEVFLLQFVTNKNQWEMLFINSCGKYLGNRWLLTSQETDIIAILDNRIIYKYLLKT